MEDQRFPKPGEIYYHFKDKPYQIITVAINTETRELMVVYQALYGDFKTYVRPLKMFISEVERDKYPEVKQKYRFELLTTSDGNPAVTYADQAVDDPEETIASFPPNQTNQEIKRDIDIKAAVPNVTSTIPAANEIVDIENPEGSVNSLLLKFLDAESYTKKLEVVTSNIKHLNDRIINDMAVALDCSVDEGPIDQRIQGLIYCLQAMCRFEDRRLR